jgi:hypothetical protein
MSAEEGDGQGLSGAAVQAPRAHVRCAKAPWKAAAVSAWGIEPYVEVQATSFGLEASL